MKDLIRIETFLAQVMRKYIDTRDNSLISELSSGLEYLLGFYNDLRWFDGVEEMELTIRKSRRLDIRGLMIWGTKGNDGRQWIEVFSADLKVDEKKDQLETWTLRFGRRGKEERRVPYEETKELLGELRKRRGWEWAEVFTKDRS